MGQSLPISHILTALLVMLDPVDFVNNGIVSPLHYIIMVLNMISI